MRTIGLFIGLALCAAFAFTYDALHALHEPWLYLWPLLGFFLAALLIVKSLAPATGLPMRLLVAAAVVGILYLAHAWQVSRSFPNLADGPVSVERLATRYQQCASVALAPTIRARMERPPAPEPSDDILWQYAATAADDICRAFTIRAWREAGLGYQQCNAGQTLQAPACYARFIESANSALPFTVAGQVVLLGLSRGFRLNSVVTQGNDPLADMTDSVQPEILGAHLKIANNFNSYRSMPAFRQSPGAKPLPTLEELEAYFRSSEYGQLLGDLQALAPEFGKSLGQLQQMRQIYADLEVEARKRGGTLDNLDSLDPETRRKYEQRINEIMQGQH